MIKIVALLCSFGLGVCFSLLGAISVKLMPRLKIDQAKFGTLVTGFMSACLVASLLMGVITDRLGYKPVAVFGFALTAVCILLLGRSKSYAAVFVSCLLLGFGAMALNTAANTLIPRVLFDGKDPAAAEPGQRGLRRGAAAGPADRELPVPQDVVREHGLGPGRCSSRPRWCSPPWRPTPRSRWPSSSPTRWPCSPSRRCWWRGWRCSATPRWTSRSATGCRRSAKR